MKKRIIIDANFSTETRVVLLDKSNNIEDVEVSSTTRKQVKGNIYLAKVTRIEPSLQAAFVDYGEARSGFLPFSEIHHDYYHLPSNDQNLSSKSSDNKNIDSKINIFVGKEMESPEITSEDLQEKRNNSEIHSLIDNDEIDIKTIEKMVNDKIQSHINIEADEDEVESFSKTSNNSVKPYKIQEVIKKGQILLIQTTKEERGNKGASLTTYISLAGKYCVLMPNKPNHNGISRKISSNEERKRLKKIITNLTSNDDNKISSVIARTAGVGHTSLEIKRDYEYLAKLWNKIREATLKSKAPCFIHQEDGILLKTIRDMFRSNVGEIIVQGQDAYKACLKFMGDILPNQIKSVKEYRGKTPIYTKFGIEDQLIKLYQPTAHLPSGGYIVINPTEALVSIDVNSGRATSERTIEEMALKTNLEAAREVSRQAYLRDLSGLIVIDFIDLTEAKNRKILERSIWEYFSKDKAKIQTSQISTFGLLEMSRQRLRPSFLEMNSNMCSHCSGKGLVRSDESNSMLILRTIENEIYNNKPDVVNVYAIASSVLYLLNNRREEILFIEKKYSIKVNLFIDRDATADSYSIEKIKLSEQKKTIIKLEGPALQDTSDIYNQAVSETTNKPSKRRIDSKHRNLEKKQNLDKNREEKSTDTKKDAINKKEDKQSQQNTKNQNIDKNKEIETTKTRKKITKKVDTRKKAINVDKKQ